ncbi:histidine kinase [Rhodococcus oxybenzonivorans]|uniref:GAF domain-containing sensor histidine kinase n=1 Tax=Rhodococcus oxybenzonivorans TaxID=1990687 RepID=UPI002952B74B|nr:GAF domain-containing protein [Rhodococcus oxybenzonivorans]MDV7357560.1 histidine kinase [Rhodococcus oxybenzonivorans]
MTADSTGSDYRTPHEALIDLSNEGLAVLDVTGRYLTINPAGQRILGCDEADLIGRRSVFLGDLDHPQSQGDSVDGTVWIGTAEVEYHVRTAPLDNAGGCRVVRFCPTDPAVRDRRALVAFTRTAAAIACENQLDVVLDRLAAEVRDTVGMATCAVILVDEVTGALHHVGRSGLPVDYAERIELCRRQGAPLATTKAIDEARVVVSTKFRDAALADPRWQPVHDILRTMDWDTYLAVPLVVRDKVIGALAGFLTEGRAPNREDIRFIAAMADQAAIAVSNAQMFKRLELQAAREERRKLARDMHDSVTQALFSLSLRTKALELSVGSGEDIDVVEQVRQIHELVCGAQTEMRALIMHRRPAALGEEGLVPSIRKHVAAVAAREGLSLVVESDDEFYELDETVEEDLFMVVGEAIHNVVKHAQATGAIVRIRRSFTDASVLTVSIVDDGIGFSGPSDDQQSFGLVSMSERVKAHGGQLTVQTRTGSDPAHGTIVRAEIPCLSPLGASGRGKM